MTDVPVSGEDLVGRPAPGTVERTGRAPLKGIHDARPQVVLFWTGAVLLPLGIVVTILCWWGAGGTPYEYDQLTYLSGSIIGMSVTFVGGFLYFASWLARIASDIRESSKRLADVMISNADLARRSASADGDDWAAGAVPVVAGAGRTIHRRDCSLIARRDDLVLVAETDRANLSRCRVCRPEV